MFNKKDPLIDSVKKVMEENQIRRNVENALNEQLGIQTKRQLPFQKHAEYDALLAEAIQEALKGAQHKIDANKNNKIDAHDFKLLRAKKETKPEEHGVEAERSMAAKGKKMYESEDEKEDKEESKEHEKKEKLDERKLNPYAVGMAAVKKSTGDEPPMEKKNIKKAHEIAKKIIKKKQMKEGILDKVTSFFKGAASAAATGGGAGSTPAGQAKPTTSMALGGASTRASAPPVGAGPGSVAPKPTSSPAIEPTGNPMGDYNPGSSTPSTPTSVAPKPAPTAARLGADPTKPDKPAPSAPRSSEVVASKAAGVPDSRSLRTAVKPAAGEGKTGSALAGLGVSKADRLNPAFLKSQGITAKAGSAEANLALRAKMGAQKAAVTAAENPKSAANAPARPSLGGGVRE